MTESSESGVEAACINQASKELETFSSLLSRWSQLQVHGRFIYLRAFKFTCLCPAVGHDLCRRAV